MSSFQWPSNSSSSSGVTTVGTIDSITAAANGAAISSTQLIMQSASTTAPGLVNLTAQSFLGQKTFSTGITATLTGAASLNVLTSALGNFTDAGTDGITITGGTGATVGAVSISQHVADTTHAGYLSATDWNTFNGKQSSGNYITSLTGDGTASGAGAAAFTLATVNGSAGSFGSASTSLTATVNAKGLITSLSSQSIQIAQSQVTGLVSALALLAPLSNPTFTGSATANNFIDGYASTVTASTTTTLLVSSVYQQFFSGSQTQVVALPVTSTLVLGQAFEIVNLSSGAVTVNSSGGNAVSTLSQNQSVICTCILTSGTSASSWSIVAGGGGTASPLTTKGDLYTYTTTNSRHAVPSNYGDIVPDSGQTDGWRNVTNTQLNAKPGKNYIQYADFENNATTGWTATGCATITNGLPVTVGSGAAAFSSSNGGRTKGANTSSPAIVSSGQLAGSYSLNLATTGAGTIGDGYISSAYTIDIADQAKVLSFKVYYKSVTGSPVMAGTSSNTYAVAIYDVANNAWLGVAGCFNFVQSSGVGIAQGTFQTASNTTSIQIFVYSPIAPVGASSLYIDDVYVGPQVMAFGPAMTDWSSYVPTITGTSSNPTKGTVVQDIAYYRRVGDSIEIQYAYYQNGAGSIGSGTYLFSLPAGIVADSTKVNITGDPNRSCIGSASGFDSGDITGFVAIYDTTHFCIALQATASTSVSSVGSTVHPLNVSTLVYNAHFTVPVSGWSSNTNLSSDSATNIVAVYGVTQSASATVNSTLGTGGALVTFTATKDSAAAYSVGQYTVPVTGWYQVSAQLNITNVSVANGNAVGVYAMVNNASPVVISNFQKCSTTSGTSYCPSMSGAVYATAGQTIGIYAYSNATTPTMATDLGGSNFSINRISGPAVVAASESVGMLYKTATGTLSGSDHLTTYTSKVLDTHSCYSSGIYTIPVSGSYSIAARISVNGTIGSGVLSTVAIYIDGVSSYADADVTAGTGTSNQYLSVVVFDIPLLAGQAVSIQSQTGATGPSFGGGASLNFLSIAKTGN